VKGEADEGPYGKTHIFPLKKAIFRRLEEEERT